MHIIDEPTPRRPPVDIDFDRAREFPHDPTFVCELDDGRLIRMSCYCVGDKLDWARGDRLARFALEGGDRFRGQPKPNPIRTWFEHRGVRFERPARDAEEPGSGPPPANPSPEPPPPIEPPPSSSAGVTAAVKAFMEGKGKRLSPR
jgi:hypothetical protein